MNDNHFDLRQAHPEVRRMKQLLDPAFKDSTGLLNGMRKHKVFRVKVSKEQVNRALCIMDALIRALEKRGAKFVKVEQSDQREIRIDEERIECLLIEETRRTERVTDDPKARAFAGGGVHAIILSTATAATGQAITCFHNFTQSQG